MNNVALKLNSSHQEIYKFISNPSNINEKVTGTNIKILHRETHDSGEKIIYEFAKDFVFGIPVLTTKVTQINNKNNHTVRTISTDNLNLVTINIDYRIVSHHPHSPHVGSGASELIIEWQISGSMAWAGSSFVRQGITDLVTMLDKKFNH